jgi:hypothetical protein
VNPSHRESRINEEIDMDQQQLQTPASVRGKRISGVVGNAIDDRENTVDLLDNAVPLQGASHADVVEYCIEAPMRFAECLALLADGRKVGLQNPCQFVGWSSESLLFNSNGKHCEVAVESDLEGRGQGCIRVVFLEEKSERRSTAARSFIGIDGDLVNLPTRVGTA